MIAVGAPQSLRKDGRIYPRPAAEATTVPRPCVAPRVPFALVRQQPSRLWRTGASALLPRQKYREWLGPKDDWRGWIEG